MKWLRRFTLIVCVSICKFVTRQHFCSLQNVDIARSKIKFQMRNNVETSQISTNQCVVFGGFTFLQPAKGNYFHQALSKVQQRQQEQHAQMTMKVTTQNYFLIIFGTSLAVVCEDFWEISWEHLMGAYDVDFLIQYFEISLNSETDRSRFILFAASCHPVTLTHTKIQLLTLESKLCRLLCHACIGIYL